jgi:hypothetical protein
MKKVRIEIIDPAKDLVDVWRLFRSSLLLEKFEHPHLGNCHEEDMQAYLSRYMFQNPGFFGMIARIGKRPVAHVFGHAQAHAIGDPKFYFFVHQVWVEPEHRGGKVMLDLWADFLVELKKRGHFFWEANLFDKFAKRLIKAKGIKVKRLSTRVGGPI